MTETTFRRILVVSLMTIGVYLPVARAEQEEAGVSASADVTLASAYVWRGQVLNDEPVLQPTFSVSKGGFSIGWWGNVALTDQMTGDEGEFSEHDFTISYTMACPLTGAEVVFGVVNFDFPNQATKDTNGVITGVAADTREVFVTYTLSEILLSPSVSINYDFKEADGFYASLGLSHGIKLAENISLELGATVGAANKDWGSFYYGGDVEGFTDWSVSAALPISITENLSVKPAVAFSQLLGDAKDQYDAGSTVFYDSEQVVVSATLSYAF